MSARRISACVSDRFLSSLTGVANGANLKSRTHRTWRSETPLPLPYGSGLGGGNRDRDAADSPGARPPALLLFTSHSSTFGPTHHLRSWVGDMLVVRKSQSGRGELQRLAPLDPESEERGHPSSTVLTASLFHFDVLSETCPKRGQNSHG